MSIIGTDSTQEAGYHNVWIDTVSGLGYESHTWGTNRENIFGRTGFDMNGDVTFDGRLIMRDNSLVMSYKPNSATVDYNIFDVDFANSFGASDFNMYGNMHVGRQLFLSDYSLPIHKGSTGTVLTMDGDSAVWSAYGAVISVTYNQLVALSGSYTVGAKYLITDFRQLYHFVDGGTGLIVGTDSGSVEPIIVMAVSATELDKGAYSTLYNKDVLYYDITGGDSLNYAYFNADGSPIVGLKGVIYFRHDTENNLLTWYDHRNIKFRRYLVDAEAWSVDSTYGKMDVVNDGGTIYYSKNNGVMVSQPSVDVINWGVFQDTVGYISWTADKTAFSVGDIINDNLIITDSVDVYTFGTGCRNILISSVDMVTSQCRLNNIVFGFNNTLIYINNNSNLVTFGYNNYDIVVNCGSGSIVLNSAIVPSVAKVNICTNPALSPPK